MATSTPTALPDALAALGAALREADLRLEVPGLAEARRARGELVDQIEDYLLPRLRQMDAPLLMVVGGSTGAGKSTLVNSLVGAEVSTPGVLRPTTRSPVLVCHPDDRHWFEDDRILPGMPRTTGGSAGPGGLQLVPTAALPAGLALLDSPDIDSVVEANRDLARQLLAAADAWLFVTTAARYADAVPWELLHAARDRGTALSLVLDRVPGEAAGEVAQHLGAMVAERGLEGVELLVVPETQLEADGRLPPDALAPVRAWLDALAADAEARSGLVSRTLTGALDSIPRRADTVVAVLADEAATADGLRADATAAYERGLDEVDDAVRSGALLRGEVLARWHDVVGTGDLMRALESRLGKLRDRVRSLVTGAPAATEELRTAVESSVDAVVFAAADRSAERAAAAWRGRPAGRVLLEGTPRLDAASPELLERTRETVRGWQGEVFELVSREAAGKRTTARFASLGVNGAGLVVMLAVFAQTGGLTGAEVVVAGGTSAVGQKVLEALLGDQAVRTLAARAREDLLRRTRELLDLEAARFHERLEAAAPPPDAHERLEAAVRTVERSR
jgi:energy-coupling factor transporter ATP-binding protein EcfA2